MTASSDRTGRTAPDADGPPRTGRGFLVLLGIGNTGAWLAYLPASQFLLPAQIGALDPLAAATNLALALSVGAALTLVTVPVAGALSDRTRTALGRRRPWMIGAVATSVTASLLLASASTVPVLVTAWALQATSVAVLLAGFNAVVGDRVPPDRRGAASAVIGASLPAAIVLGAVVVGNLVTDVATGHRFVAAGTLLLVGAFLLGVPEPVPAPTALPALRPGPLLRGLVIDPRRSPDLGRAWLGRFLLFFGFTIGTSNFLFLYLQHGLDYPALFPGSDVAQGLAVLLLLSTAMIVPATVLSGVLSDRSGRRRPFAAGGALTLAAGLALMAAAPAWPTTLVAVSLIGLGLGTYLGVNVALHNAVVSSAADRGRDLGRVNVASDAAQVVAPIVGAAILNGIGLLEPGAYRILFLAGTAAALLAAVPLARLREAPR